MPTHCQHCGSEDLDTESAACPARKVTCLDCDAYAVVIGSYCEWVTPRTVRRARALVADTLRRHESA